MGSPLVSDGDLSGDTKAENDVLEIPRSAADYAVSAGVLVIRQNDAEGMLIGHDFQCC